LNINITGITGFVGKNLSYFLQQLGYNVKSINLRKNISIDNINDCDVLIHLAGIAHDLKGKYNFNDYYNINYELTKKLYDLFLQSNCKTFIFFSSIKAVTDKSFDILTEETSPNPTSDYGKTKLLAEQYIIANPPPPNKKYFIIRPSMIHGQFNKGNLNLLFRFARTRLPWPFGFFNNQRSFCSIDNLNFIINEFIVNLKIQPGVFNIADTDSISTNELYKIICDTLDLKVNTLNVPKIFIKTIATIGSICNLPFNKNKLQKLTETLLVDNSKIINSIGKKLPVDIRDGLKKTISTFKYNK
jgi:nucleoside-diphosphate-sugar epimerase